MPSYRIFGAAPAKPSTLDSVGWCLLLVFVFVLPLSIAAASIILTLLLFLWVTTIAVSGRQPSLAPRFFWPLLAYAAWTLLTVAFSLDPMTSLIDSKEVLLFLVVPIVYRLARGERASTVATLVLTVGAVTAVIGVVQYGILEYDNLGQRPSGSMGHYMTYSGLLMLMITVAVARILFGTSERMWALIVLPALAVALVLTLTRNAMVGASIGVALLFVLKDVRLLAVAPVVATVFFVVAPAQITDRVYSTFDLQDPTNRDRLAMVTAGTAMIRDYPLTGVGPDMVKEVYAAYRPPDGINDINPHLHNVPLQIAAERGLPAVALFAWFIAAVIVDLIGRFRRSTSRELAAAGLASIACMLTAGIFEYNFGDSEFLMLLLVLITLPSAASFNEPATTSVNDGSPAHAG